MANEIKINLNGTVQNGVLKDTITLGGEVLYDQATPGGPNPGSVSVGTSEQDISFAGLTSPAFVFLRNTDDTNFVKYGPKNGSNVMEELGRLRPGGFAFLELAPSVTLRMVSDTAVCLVLVQGYEL
ncbi:hypothetical protein KOR42_06180 [Thalassoglobus neptunius]|uniref:Uncharacterized protein n=1 Tax=Thalassoglobus neptunius TaxID=1938619 RepID=A0A5C5X346_9PLAN|nr:hypothetical protein [Thalassoglobus neptunius]TWT57260.1 hypothetical protein KOR42_06180 [Thalassoglobus neptunius]